MTTEKAIFTLSSDETPENISSSLAFLVGHLSTAQACECSEDLLESLMNIVICGPSETDGVNASKVLSLLATDSNHISMMHSLAVANKMLGQLQVQRPSAEDNHTNILQLIVTQATNDQVRQSLADAGALSILYDRLQLLTEVKNSDGVTPQNVIRQRELMTMALNELLTIPSCKTALLENNGAEYFTKAFLQDTITHRQKLSIANILKKMAPEYNALYAKQAHGVCTILVDMCKSESCTQRSTAIDVLSTLLEPIKQDSVFLCESLPEFLSTKIVSEKGESLLEMLRLAHKCFSFKFRATILLNEKVIDRLLQIIEDASHSNADIANSNSATLAIHLLTYFLLKSETNTSICGEQYSHKSQQLMLQKTLLQSNRVETLLSVAYSSKDMSSAYLLLLLAEQSCYTELNATLKNNSILIAFAVNLFCLSHNEDYWICGARNLSRFDADCIPATSRLDIINKAKQCLLEDDSKKDRYIFMLFAKIAKDRNYQQLLNGAGVTALLIQKLHEYQEQNNVQMILAVTEALEVLFSVDNSYQEIVSTTKLLQCCGSLINGPDETLPDDMNIKLKLAALKLIKYCTQSLENQQLFLECELLQPVFRIVNSDYRYQNCFAERLLDILNTCYPATADLTVVGGAHVLNTLLINSDKSVRHVASVMNHILTTGDSSSQKTGNQILRAWLMDVIGPGRKGLAHEKGQAIIKVFLELMKTPEHARRILTISTSEFSTRHIEKHATHKNHLLHLANACCTIDLLYSPLTSQFRLRLALAILHIIPAGTNPILADIENKIFNILEQDRTDDYQAVKELAWQILSAIAKCYASKYMKHKCNDNALLDSPNSEHPAQVINIEQLVHLLTANDFTVINWALSTLDTLSKKTTLAGVREILVKSSALPKLINLLLKNDLSIELSKLIALVIYIDGDNIAGRMHIARFLSTFPMTIMSPLKFIELQHQDAVAKILHQANDSRLLRSALNSNHFCQNSLATLVNNACHRGVICKTVLENRLAELNTEESRSSGYNTNSTTVSFWNATANGYTQLPANPESTSCRKRTQHA